MTDLKDFIDSLSKEEQEFIIAISDENKQLKDKLKHYTEPFEMRPTYQILEQKLEQIKEFNENHLSSPLYNKLKAILEKKI